MNREFVSIIKRSTIWIFIIFVIGLLSGLKSMYIGHTLGGIISIIQAFMLYFEIEKIVNFGVSSRKFTLISYGKRYLLSAVVLGSMLMIDKRHFAFAIIGLHSVKIMVVIPYFYYRIKKKLVELNEKYNAEGR